jgi:hypothetical protein
MEKPNLRDVVLGAVIQSALSKGNAGTDGNTDGPKKKGIGCGAIFGLLLLIGLIGLGLQKIGGMSSEETLRSRASVTVTGIDVLEAKNLLVVKFTVKNDTKWPVTMQLDCCVRKTTTSGEVARNTVSVEGIPPKASSEQRVMFDLNQLKNAGITDPKDKDICTIAFKIASIAEAGK